MLAFSSGAWTTSFGFSAAGAAISLNFDGLADLFDADFGVPTLTLSFIAIKNDRSNYYIHN